MTNWRQVTTVNGEQEYEERILTADEMVDRLAQVMFLRQSGEDITLDRELNERNERVKYIITRRFRNGEVVVKTITKI